MSQHLVLSGPPGSGKSTVARLVAERAGAPLLDLDAAVEVALGRSVSRAFEELGEPAFRAAEEALLAEALERGVAHVVAVGGGALVSERSRASALLRGRVVTLTAPLDVLCARVKGAGRPLLSGEPAAALAGLLAARRAVYRDAHVRLDSRADAASVAARVLAAWLDPAVSVRLGDRSYGVRFAADPVAAALDLARVSDASGLFVVTDEHVAALWGARFAAEVGAGAPIVIPSGEGAKRLMTVERVAGELAARGADRSSLVLGLGGGVVTDLTGLVAALWHRGVRWAAIPTTLLGSIDAAIGGKTGVDLEAGKNLLGALHQPEAVLVASPYLATEPARSRRSGEAELVKTALVGDGELFAAFEQGRAPDDAPLRAARVKCAIVSRDERESGERMLLNLGHTVGHALEAQAGFSRLSHGEAVALGTVAELEAGELLGLGAPGLADRARRVLQALGLPVDRTGEPVEESLSWMLRDKKRRGSAVGLTVLSAPGVARVEWVNVGALAAALTRKLGHDGPPP